MIKKKCNVVKWEINFMHCGLKSVCEIENVKREWSSRERRHYICDSFTATLFQILLYKVDFGE